MLNAAIQKPVQSILSWQHSHRKQPIFNLASAGMTVGLCFPNAISVDLIGLPRKKYEMNPSKKKSQPANRRLKRYTPVPDSFAPEMAFRNKVADKIEMVHVSKLRLPKRDARVHTEEQIAMMMLSFDTYGMINPLVIDENAEMVTGVARYEVARRLGIECLPCVVVTNWTSELKRAYRVAENMIAEKAGWDAEILSIECKELSIEFTAEQLGLTAPELDVIIDFDKSDLETQGDPADAVPPVDPIAITRLGDRWLLGDHALICADATKAETYPQLMQGKKGRMVFTDPPYNTKVSNISGLGKHKHREFVQGSDPRPAAEFQEFLAASLGNAASTLVDGGLVYTFMDFRQQLPLMLALEGIGLTQINLCVWAKTTGGMGSFYRGAHELCWVYKYGDAPHLNMVELGRHGRYRTNVWHHAGMSSFNSERDEALKMHPTVKPVGLLTEAIKDCTRRGDIVVDPFAGSGSTLIAAHKTGRICFGMELDPLYCDVIIRRFEQFTGIAAIHAESGSTFAEICAERMASTKCEDGE